MTNEKSKRGRQETSVEYLARIEQGGMSSSGSSLAMTASYALGRGESRRCRNLPSLSQRDGDEEMEDEDVDEI